VSPSNSLLPSSSFSRIGCLMKRLEKSRRQTLELDGINQHSSYKPSIKQEPYTRQALRKQSSQSSNQATYRINKLFPRNKSRKPKRRSLPQTHRMRLRYHLSVILTGVPNQQNQTPRRRPRRLSRLQNPR